MQGLGRLGFIGLLLAATWGCDSGSPTAPVPSALPPPAPSPVTAQVAGLWVGELWSQAFIYSQEACLDPFYLAEFSSSARVTMIQFGSSVTGTVVSDVQKCDFTGTVDGQRLLASLTTCQRNPVKVSSNCDGLDYKVAMRSGTITGEFDVRSRSFEGNFYSQLRGTNGSGTVDDDFVSGLRLTKQ